MVHSSKPICKTAKPTTRIWNRSGWDTAVFNDAQWMSQGLGRERLRRLVPQPDEPIRAITVLIASNRTQPVTGRWIYDLGQNMVGVPKILLTGTNGKPSSGSMTVNVGDCGCVTNRCGRVNA